MALSMAPCFRRTQCPSFRSIAGMISMQQAGGCGGPRVGSGWAWQADLNSCNSIIQQTPSKEKRPRTRGRSLANQGHLQCSLRGGMAAIPLHEVRQQPQARLLALLRVELHGEQIIPGYRAGERNRIRGCSRRSVRGCAAPDSSCARSKTALPWAMPRHRGCSTVWCTSFHPMCGTFNRSPAAPTMPCAWEAHHPAREQAQAGHIALLAHCRTASAARCRCQGTACFAPPPARRGAGRERPARACSRASRPGREIRPGAPQRTSSGRLVTTTLSAGRHMLDGLGHRAQVAHPIVDDGDVDHFRVLRVRGRSRMPLPTGCPW